MSARSDLLSAAGMLTGLSKFAGIPVADFLLQPAETWITS
jgi:hypothetical protein